MAYISTEPAVSKAASIKWLPLRAKLRDGRAVRLARVDPTADGATIDAMHQLMNYELVVRGDSYPFPPVPLTREQFVSYYCAFDTFVLVLEQPAAAPATAEGYDFGRQLVGCFYVKPNYPYRSAHVCNAGFMVVPSLQRGLGAGELMARAFLVLADDLGYRHSMFNLVYSTNAGSIRLWDKLGFQRVSVIPGGGQLKSRPGVPPHGRAEETTFADAFQYLGDVKRLAPAQRTYFSLGSSKL
jgi:ribosomal protein S18 acetylase RimI-like enzyme